jgi:hypothetical protein
MSVRERVIKHFEQGRVILTILPLSFRDDLAVRTMWPGVFAEFSDRSIPVYVWDDHGIYVNEHSRTFYPQPSDEEIVDAMSFPLPNDKFIVETKVPRHDDTLFSHYFWIVKSNVHGFEAMPLTFTGNQLQWSGQLIVFDRTNLRENGTPVFMRGVPTCYDKLYDVDELWDHRDLLLRFIRNLGHPKVEIEVHRPDVSLNNARTKKGKPPLSEYRVIRLNPFYYKKKSDEPTGRTHNSPHGHERRAHTRTLKSGRVVDVKKCHVKGGPALQAA